MNYEKKYKEALEKLQEALAPTEDGCKISGLTRGCIEAIFHELKESELKESDGERIRKDIISYLRNEKIVKRYISDIEIDKWIAWLEKQGENTLDHDEVIEWLRQNICTACYNEPDVGQSQRAVISQRIDKFKKDFGL